MEQTEPRAPRRPRFLVGVWVLVLLVVVAVLVARGQEWGPFAPDAQEDPDVSRSLYVDPASSAAEGAAAASAAGDSALAGTLERLASVPQGIWLTPEELPPGEVGPYVTGVVTAADDAGATPVLVVYGIPDRDCTGGFSTGGLPPDLYGGWVGEIATAAAAGESIVVLEPDALASAVDCDRRDQRVRLLAEAVDRLRSAGVTTYVDGGHSAWVPAQELADLLRQVGVETVRGFATNVSNFQTDADERAYAEELSGLLGGAHYVIDRSRNGNGATGEWCNPTGRAFGDQPTLVDDGSALDAYLWVKPAGESDGECGGGPPAGELWPERVQELAAASGW